MPWKRIIWPNNMVKALVFSQEQQLVICFQLQDSHYDLKAQFIVKNGAVCSLTFKFWSTKKDVVLKISCFDHKRKADIWTISVNGPIPTVLQQGALEAFQSTISMLSRDRGIKVFSVPAGQNIHTTGSDTFCFMQRVLSILLLKLVRWHGVTSCSRLVAQQPS